MKRLPFLLLWGLAVSSGYLVGGCGSSDDTTRQVFLADSAAQTRRTNFETKTDTVTLQRSAQHGETGDSQNNERLQFMVQIGSFSESRNAKLVQSRARKRYRLPVVKEYNAARRRYQIRIGFFQTEQAANEFRLRLIDDYPGEYKGAWVVRVNK